MERSLYKHIHTTLYRPNTPVAYVPPTTSVGYSASSSVTYSTTYSIASNTSFCNISNTTSNTLTGTISTTIQILICDIFTGLQFIAKGVVDFISNNYDLIGLIIGFGMMLPMLWRMFHGVGLRRLFNLFG